MEGLERYVLSDYTHNYLTFSLADELFALPLAQVREIIFYRNVSPIPLMPNFMRGICNLRGHVMPVIDLAVRLGREPQALHKRSSIVICVLTTGQLLGVLVDAVCDVLVLLPDTIEAAPLLGTEIRHDFIHGVAAYHDGFVVVLDAERVLHMSELAELTQQAHLAFAQQFAN
ncbi:chemotaxis protein CheW [Chitinibacter sp. SCUT-21]|uniref:chemotaxis protein CheW n=1 Tax=Chitinibacter sp. SCUT-21 TaxID=2970891 RepID=UPI0035A61D86